MTGAAGFGAVGLGGWLVAFAVALATRARTVRRAAVVADAVHELRGAITAACLAIELGDRTGGLSGERLRAVELELGCAALVLEDLGSENPGARPVAGPGLVGLEDLVENVGDAWRGVATAAGVELLVGAIPRGWLYADRRRLAQAIGNLVANAVEHGGGVVELSARHVGEKTRIEVTDAGPGLTAPVAELIGRRRKRGARGHGLAIASAIAVEAGGSLSAAPSERGARLVLELPAAAPRNSRTAE